MGFFDKLFGSRDLPYSDDDGPDDGLPFATYGDYDDELPTEGGSDEGAYHDDEDPGLEGVEFGLDDGEYDDDYDPEDGEDDPDDW